jgi:hypothetical protein
MGEVKRRLRAVEDETVPTALERTYRLYRASQYSFPASP